MNGLTTTTLYDPSHSNPVEPFGVTEEIIIPVLVRAHCRRRECDGEMAFTGRGITPGISPTVWEHKCENCGKVETYTRTYPAQEFRPLP